MTNQTNKQTSISLFWGNVNKKSQLPEVKMMARIQKLCVLVHMQEKVCLGVHVYKHESSIEFRCTCSASAYMSEYIQK